MKVKTNTGKILIGATIAALVLIIIWLSVLLLTRPVVNDTTTVTKIEEIEKTVTGSKLSDDLSKVMGLSKDLMTTAIDSQSSGLETVLSEVEEGDFTKLSKDFKEYFRLVGELDTIDNTILAYQSVMIVAYNINESNPELEFVPNAEEAVFIDQEAGIASVPASVFTGINNGLYFQWVRVDGKWSYSPYPLIQSTILAAGIASSESAE